MHLLRIVGTAFFMLAVLLTATKILGIGDSGGCGSNGIMPFACPLQNNLSDFSIYLIVACYAISFAIMTLTYFHKEKVNAELEAFFKAKQLEREQLELERTKATAAVYAESLLTEPDVKVLHELINKRGEKFVTQTLSNRKTYISTKHVG